MFKLLWRVVSAKKWNEDLLGFFFSAGLESCNGIRKTNLVWSSLSQHWLCSVYLKEISQLCLKNKNEFVNLKVVVGWYQMLKWKTLRKHDGWKRNFLWWRHQKYRIKSILHNKISAKAHFEKLKLFAKKKT